MKKSNQNPKMKSIFLTVCLLMMSVVINAQDVKPKNNITLFGGVSIPSVTMDSSLNPSSIASNGSNFSLSYGREIFKTKNNYFTIDVRYSNFSNPYSEFDSDLKIISSNFSSSLGTWSGNYGNYKLSSYLLGIGWYRHISKDKKWAYFFKIYLGSGSLTSPSETFNASTGFFIKLNEINTNGFVYSSNTGISYEINNNISLLVNIEYLKSYFVINNQKITFSGGSQDVTPYFLKYDNIGINGGISFKF